MATATELQALRNAGCRIDYDFTGSSHTVTDLLNEDLIEDRGQQYRGAIDFRFAGDQQDNWPVDDVSYIKLAVKYYDLAGALVHIETMGTFYPQNAVYDDASDSTLIRAVTKERYLIDNVWNLDEINNPAIDTYSDLVDYVTALELPSGVSGVVQNKASAANTHCPVALLRNVKGSSFMTHLDRVLETIDCWLYVNRLNNFVLEERQETDGYGYPLSSLNFLAGASKLVTKITHTRNREEWYNTANLRYWWDNGTERQDITGHAEVQSGPMSPAEAGRKVYYQQYSAGMTQAEADAAARDTLRALLRRSEVLTIEAVACHWVKAGDRFSYDGKTWHIRRVQFNLKADTMTITGELLSTPATVV